MQQPDGFISRLSRSAVLTQALNYPESKLIARRRLKIVFSLLDWWIKPRGERVRVIRL
ncbi:hypothetical protein GCM10010149_33210 [Nonomuraea roseoviolacea subsp. roseoviolacea]